MELVNKDVKAIEELKKICDMKQEVELENGKELRSFSYIKNCILRTI